MLPFPTRRVEVRGGSIDEYIIPDESREAVLDQLYIFDPVPSLDEELYDLHEGKRFRVRDFKVIWERGRNYLMSPYYLSSGGSVIDWVSVELGEDV